MSFKTWRDETAAFTLNRTEPLRNERVRWISQEKRALVTYSRATRNPSMKYCAATEITAPMVASDSAIFQEVGGVESGLPGRLRNQTNRPLVFRPVTTDRHDSVSYDWVSSLVGSRVTRVDPRLQVLSGSFNSSNIAQVTHRMAPDTRRLVGFFLRLSSISFVFVFYKCSFVIGDPAGRVPVS